MGFVEEENQLRLIEIAHLRERFIKVVQQLQQEGGVYPRGVHQLIGSQDVDHPFALLGLDKIGYLQIRFPEKLVGSLVLQPHQPALDGTDARRGDIAVFGGELFSVLADELQHLPQILQVDQQQVVVVGNPKRHRENRSLGFVEVEQSLQQQGTYGGDGGAHGVALFSKHVPKTHGERLVFESFLRQVVLLHPLVY